MSFEYLNATNTSGLRYNEATFNTDLNGNSIIVVRTDNEQGYYDMEGNYISFHEKCYNKDFFEGMTIIEEGKKFGFMDLSGNVVVKPQYDNVWPFRCGIAMVRSIFGEGVQYIDKGGNCINKSDLASGFGFCEGLAAVEVVVNGQYKRGFINQTGDFVIEPIYDHAVVFCGGIANVNLGRKSLYIDKKGNIVEPIFGKYEHRFYNNLMLIQTNHRYGYVNELNKIEIEPQFTMATHFSEGLAGVKKKGEKYGFIDTTGKYIIEPEFDDVGCFSNGLCVIKKGKKYGYINKLGDIIIKPTFEEAMRFDNNGLAIVKKDGNYGLIDNKGEWIVSPEFDRIWSYKKICLVRIGDKFDVIRLIK